MSEVRHALIKEILWIMITTVVVSILVVFVFHLYEIDLNTMIDVDNDSIGVASLAHNYIMQIKQGNAWSALKNILCSKNLDGSFLHEIGLFLCCLFFDSFGTAVNFYYFAGYIMVALGMYFAARILKKENWIAAISGVVYTFLPYHYVRGESHLFLACYYMVPLGAAIIVRLMDLEEKYKPAFYKLCIFISILFGLTDIYYSVFYAILLFFALIYRAYNKKNLKELFLPIGLILIPFIIVTIVNLYYFKFSEKNAVTSFVASDTRTLWDLQAFGLKPFQLITPISNHRIKIFADFRANLDAYGYNDLHMSSLGLVMAIGLVISVFLVLVSEKNNHLKKYGILNLYSILVSCINGLNIIVGLITSNIRCYYRMSVFIAAFSMFFIVDWVHSVWMAKRDRIKIRRIIYACSAVIMLFSVWDQTMSFSQEQYQKNWNLNYNTKQAVESIDLLTEDSSKVLMLPILEYGELMRYNMRAYEQSWNDVYSDNLVWITARNQEYVNWLRELSIQPPDKIPVCCAVSDIEGIWLDENGYEDSEFLIIKEILDKTLGNPLVISKSGKQYYYSLKPFKGVMSRYYSEDEIEELKRRSNELLN